MSLRLLSLVLAVALGGCGRTEAPPPPGEPLPAVDLLLATWPLQAALDESIDGRTLAAVAGRWLGGDGSWQPPGSARDSLPALLRARMLREDAAAVEHLAWVLKHAACRLAQEPTSFDASLPEGFAVGQRSCASLGDADAAALAGRHLAALGGEVPGSEAGQGTRLAVIERSLDVVGESLHYAFVEPAELERFVEAIAALAPPPAPPPGPTLSVTDSFSTLAGTARLGLPSLADGDAIWSALPQDGRQAAAESALDRAVTRFSAALGQVPSAGVGAVDAAGKALLEGWVQRALYRDLGLRALDAGEPGLAQVLLEEAAGSSARHRPGPGLDPLLLAGLARARYASNELRRAVDLLEDMGQAPGWSLSSHAARSIARVAVLPTAAEPQVNR